MFTHAHYLIVTGLIAPLFLIGFIIFINSDDDSDSGGAATLGVTFLGSLALTTTCSYFRLKGEEFHLHAPTGLAYIEMIALAIVWICILTSFIKSKQKEKQVHTLLEKIYYQELTPSFSSKDVSSFFQGNCTLQVTCIRSGMKIDIFHKETSICSFSYVNGSVKESIPYLQIDNYIKKHPFFFSSLEKKLWKFDFSFPTPALTTALNELSSYVAQLDRSKLTLEERLFFQQAFEEELPLIHQTFQVEHEQEVKEVFSFLTEKVKARVHEQQQTEKLSQDSTLQQSIHRIYKKGQEFTK
jgi:hypothetical protein